MRTRIVACTLIIGAALILVTSVSFWANRDDAQSFEREPGAVAACTAMVNDHDYSGDINPPMQRSMDLYDCLYERGEWRAYRTFDMGGYLAWIGSIVLGGLVVLGLTFITTRRAIA